jgi:asparagine synthase (glutamine-hydrolysing)
MDGFRLFDAWDDPDKIPPEPVEEPLSAAWSEEKRFLSSHARVGLSGTGGDNLLHFQMWPYVKDLLRRHCCGALCKDLAQYLWIRPFPWKGLREKSAGLVGRKNEQEPGYPSWIQANFAERMRLAERWNENVFSTQVSHPLCPKGHASLALPHWTYSFELADPGVTRALVEVRYPYLDLRMVNYLLAIPTFPWSFQKRLIRNAMSDRLPDVIRLRAKTPLAENPVSGALRRREHIESEEVQFEKEFERFIDIEKLSESSRPKTSGETSLLVRPLCLNFWLRSAWRRYTVTVGGN